MVHVQAYDSLVAASKEEGTSVRDAALNADLRKVRPMPHACPFLESSHTALQL